MDTVDERTKRRDESNRIELAELIAGSVGADGVVEAAPGLRLTRASEPTDRIHAVSLPSLCIIAQGAKEVYLGESLYRYDSERYLLATIEVPLTGRVVEATRSRPYLALRLDLDPVLVGSVMVEAGVLSANSQSDAKAIVVSTLDSELLDAVVRLVRLLRSPSEAGVLLPLVKREIVFRLLIGDQGARLRHLPLQGSHSDRIAKAVQKLRREFDRPLRVEALAKELGMSPSGFHHHFKAVTEMSPLQYQKQIRLQEARQLMLGENLDASSAGYRVGYEDPSHFSRDYKRLFGDAPARDAERLRSLVAAD